MNHYDKIRKKVLKAIRHNPHNKYQGITDYYSTYYDWKNNKPKTQICQPSWHPFSKRVRKMIRAGLLAKPIYPNIVEAEGGLKNSTNFYNFS